MQNEKDREEAFVTVNRLLALAEEIDDLANRVNEEDAIGDLGSFDPDKPLRDAAEAVAFSAVIIAYSRGFHLSAAKERMR